MQREAWEQAQRLFQKRRAESSILDYADDPVGFGETFLGYQYTDDIRNVMLSVRDNPVTIARSANGTGKTHAAASVAVWYFRTRPTSKVYLTSSPPEENLIKGLWGEVTKNVSRAKDFTANSANGDMFHGFTINAETVFRDSQSFMTTVAIPMSANDKIIEARFAGKHAPFLLFICDEGDGIPEAVYRGIESCMSGGEVRLLIMFNPRMRAGSVYTKEMNRQANVIPLSAFNHPNVVTGNNIIPGAVDRNITARRIIEWTRPATRDDNITEFSFEVPDFMVGVRPMSDSGVPLEPISAGRRIIHEPAFSYMVLGEYPAQDENVLISAEWITAARNRYDLYTAQYGSAPPIGIRPIIGLDCAEFGPDYNVACIRYGGYVAPFRFWGGVDVDESASRGHDMYNSYGAEILLVDASGVGSAVAPIITKRARRNGDQKVAVVSVKVGSKPTNLYKIDQGEFFQLRDQLWWMMREWLRKDPNAMLPPDKMLVEELQAVTYKNTNEGKIKVADKDSLRKLIGRSTDRADALCLTFAPFERARIVKLGDKPFRR